MGGLKTYLLALTLAVTASAPVLSARAATPRDQLHIFATCTGRLSAQMEYQWMFDGNGSEATETARAALIDILDAIMTPDEDRDVLNWRIEAKAAQAALLTRAIFNTDRRDAQLARRAARRKIDECQSLLLS